MTCYLILFCGMFRVSIPLLTRYIFGYKIEVIIWLRLYMLQVFFDPFQHEEEIIKLAIIYYILTGI